MSELNFVPIHTVRVHFQGGSSCAAVFSTAELAEEFCDLINVTVRGGDDAPSYGCSEEVGIQHGEDIFFIDCWGNVLKVKPLTVMPAGDTKFLLSVGDGSVTPLDPENGENGRFFGQVFKRENPSLNVYVLRMRQTPK